MARKYTKRITEEEFSDYLTMRDGFSNRIKNEEAWAKISDQEKARYERDYYALEVKLFHTLGFKDREISSAEFLGEAQNRFEVYRELNLIEDKQLKERNKAKYEQYVQEQKDYLSKYFALHPELLKEAKAQEPTEFGEAYLKLNKINK